MKAILTVIGKDQVGIIAGVSTELQKLNINILDVTQTIMHGYFTMIMMIDLSKISCDFDNVKKTSGVSTELQKLNINILDVTQTIMHGYFTMIMMIDLSKISCDFDNVKKTLLKKGQVLGVDVKIQREEIFNSMHTL